MTNKIFTEIVAQDSFSPVFKKLGESIRGNALAANLMASGITSAIGAATSAVSSLTKSLGEAAELQLNNASAAGTFAALTGKSFSDGEEFIDRLNSRLGEVAAALPGATQDYKTLALGIQDNLIPAFKDASGAFDSKGFEEELITITKGMEVLGASSQTAAKDVSKFAGKFLGGASLSELKNLLFAENNTGFLALVEKRLEGTGKKLEQLTLKERKEILKAVSEQLVTPEVIKAASGSVSGLIESLKSNLFDPTNGLFGLMRDLDSKTKGNQTVLTAINESLSLLIGDDGLLTELSKTLESLGLTFDPMLALRNGILKFNSTIKSLRDFVKDINQTFLPPKSKDEKIDYFKLRKGIVTYFQDSFSNYLSQLSKINFIPFSKGLGENSAKLTNQILEGALSLFKSINWLALGGTINNVIRGIIEGLVSYIKTIDYLKVVEVLLTVVDGALIGLAYLIGSTLKNLSDIYIRESMNVWNSVVSYISGKLGEFTGFIGSKFSELTNFLGSKWNDITSAASNTFDSIKNWFTDLLSKIPGIGGQFKTNTSGSFVPNAASGMNVSLLEAIARENRAKPSDSSREGRESTYLFSLL
jgi:hypothetical protein